MPVQVSYPGVYIEEIPSGNKTLAGVSTSITAFIGRAPKGPTDRDPTSPAVVLGFDDFERMFGGLSYDYPMTYAVKDFFDNGGAQAVIVRLFEPYYANQNQWKKIYNNALQVARAGNSADTPKACVDQIVAAGEDADPDPQVTQAKGAVARRVSAFYAENPGATTQQIQAVAVASVDKAAPVTNARLRLDGLNLALAAAESVAKAIDNAMPEPLPTSPDAVKKAAKAMADAGDEAAAGFADKTALEHTAAAEIAKVTSEEADKIRTKQTPTSEDLLQLDNTARTSIDQAVFAAVPGMGDGPKQDFNAANSVAEAASNKVVELAQAASAIGRPAASAVAKAAVQQALLSGDSGGKDVVDAAEKRAGYYTANPAYGAAKAIADAADTFVVGDKTVEEMNAAIQALSTWLNATGEGSLITTVGVEAPPAELPDGLAGPKMTDDGSEEVDMPEALWKPAAEQVRIAAVNAIALKADDEDAATVAGNAATETAADAAKVAEAIGTVTEAAPGSVATAADQKALTYAKQLITLGMALDDSDDPIKGAADAVAKAANDALGSKATTDAIAGAADTAAKDGSKALTTAKKAAGSGDDAKEKFLASLAGDATEVGKKVSAAAKLRDDLDTDATLDEVTAAAQEAVDAAQSVATATSEAKDGALRKAQEAGDVAAKPFANNPAGDAAQRVVNAANGVLSSNPMAKPSEISRAATIAIEPDPNAMTPTQVKQASGEVMLAAVDEATKVSTSTTTEVAASSVVQAMRTAMVANPAITPEELAAVASGAVASAANKALTQSQALLTDTDVLVLEAANEGSWGTFLTAAIDTEGITDEAAAPYGLTAADMFNLVVNYSPLSGAAKAERFINVSINPDAGDRRLDRVLANSSTLVRVPVNDNGIGPRLPEKTPEAGATAKASVAVDSWSLNNLSYLGSENLKTGMYALERADLFNLMCIPPDSRSSTAPGWDTSNMVYAQAMQYCEKRRAFLIIDPPQAWADKAATGQINAIKLSDLGNFGPEARNAAVYFPRIVKPDPMLQGHPEVFAASGMIAGIMARTDVARGVWKAPAGTEAGLSGIQGLEVKLTDGQNGLLNPYGINCLRTFPVIGSVVWGARTMRGADQLSDDYKYVPVRRLTLYIEESLYRGTQWAVFEPNDATLWNQLRNTVNDFMSDLMRQGAFYSYEVICDKSTTTSRDINLGIVNMVVAFAPVRPAEFVVIKIQQQAVTV